MTILNNFAILLPLVIFLVLWLLFYFAFWAVGTSLRTGAQLVSRYVVNVGFIKRGLANPLWMRMHPYLPITLVLLAGVGAAAFAGMAFIYLAEQFNSTTSGVFYEDQLVNHWFQAERMPGFTTLLRAITTGASPIGLGILVTVIAIGLYFRKHHASAIFIATAAIGVPS